MTQALTYNTILCPQLFLSLCLFLGLFSPDSQADVQHTKGIKAATKNPCNLACSMSIHSFLHLNTLSNLYSAVLRKESEFARDAVRVSFSVLLLPTEPFAHDIFEK